uniref:non-specific serine/threonine protein kinase n=1 Tax=Quercus lobata TaxID=97700 RepID=A0A7N2LLI5_QUELO
MRVLIVVIQAHDEMMTCGFYEIRDMLIDLGFKGKSDRDNGRVIHANFLMKVHHKNLTSFVGYCHENTNMGLIYEYMANGNLAQHLSGVVSADKNSSFLSWETRLKIAMDSAQGLEYLHNGCKPPIIHRDVKSTNILLDENFQAKLTDLGLSRIISSEGGTHVSTKVVGTPGYLDPE